MRSLRPPFTEIVLMIAVPLGAWVALQRMTRDIFPLLAFFAITAQTAAPIAAGLILGK